MKAGVGAAGIPVEIEPHQLGRSPQLRNRLTPRRVVRELLRRGGELAPTAMALTKTRALTRVFDEYFEAVKA